MSPFEMFSTWYVQAEKGGQIEPNAMVLSTVDEKGSPSSRVVLLKVTEENTFYFFTNYNSPKSKMLLNHKKAALNFHWRLPFHRQVRIEGDVTKASAEVSDNYFKTRPRGSQIGAWSSPQSQSIENREFLESLVKKTEEQFKGRDVPRPEFWGGFGIKPNRFEFWQEGESRLHERNQFVLIDGKWSKNTLAP